MSRRKSKRTRNTWQGKNSNSHRRDKRADRRQMESREAQLSHATAPDNEYDAGSLFKLPKMKNPDGKAFRWIARSILGGDTTTYIPQLRAGWMPVRRDELDASEAHLYASAKWDDGSDIVVAGNGSILCQMEESTAIAMDNYFERKALKQRGSVYGDAQKYIGNDQSPLVVDSDHNIGRYDPLLQTGPKTMQFRDLED